MKAAQIRHAVGFLILVSLLILGYQNCQQGGAGLSGLKSLGGGNGEPGVPDPDYLEIQIGDGGLNPFPVSDTANPVIVNFSCVTAGLTNIQVSGSITRGTATQAASSTCNEDTGQGQISFPRPVSTSSTGNLTLTIRGRDQDGASFTKTDSVAVRYQTVTAPPPPPPPARSISIYNVAASGQELIVEYIAKGYAPTDTYQLQVDWVDQGIARTRTAALIFPANQEPRGSVGLSNPSNSNGVWTRPISITVRDLQRNLSDSKNYVAPLPAQYSQYYMATIDSCATSAGSLRIALQFEEARDAQGNPASGALRTGTIEYRNITSNGPWRSVGYSGEPDAFAVLDATIPQTSPDLSNLASDTILLRINPGTPITGPFYGGFFQGGRCGR